jgi:hypothetical protein
MIFKKVFGSLQGKASVIHADEQGQLLAVWLTAFMAVGSVFLGTAYDMSNAWVHKQWADTAAEASCTAGAMDMAYSANAGGAPSTPDPSFNFLLSGSGDCAGGESNAMCYYANLNGYTSTGAANDVQWNLSAVAPSNATPSAGIVNGFTSNGVPAYLNVSVTEQVPVTFMGIFAKAFHMSNSWKTVQVVGHCNCGLGGAPGAAASGLEQSVTAQCPTDQASFSWEWEWAGAAPDQLRSAPGGNEPLDWVNFDCKGGWVDSSGVSHPQNYFSTIPGATIDGVNVSLNVCAQGPSAGYPVVRGMELIGSKTGFSDVVNWYTPVPYTLPGERQNIEPYTDKGEPLYGFIQPCNNGDPFVTYGTIGPEAWAATPPLWGVSQADMINALSNDADLGFSLSIQGAQGPDQRMFIGGGNGYPPYITIYYHMGGGALYATSFSNN